MFRLADADIGVIAPYHAQVQKLRKSLLSVAEGIKVGSVEEFQGQVRLVTPHSHPKPWLTSLCRNERSSCSRPSEAAKSLLSTTFATPSASSPIHAVSMVGRCLLSRQDESLTSLAFVVAITRAQALLIVVGDPQVLGLDPLWRAFLNYIYLNGGWAGPDIPWDPKVDVDEAGGYDEAVRAAARLNMDELARRMESMALAEVEGDDDGVDRPWRDTE